MNISKIKQSYQNYLSENMDIVVDVFDTDIFQPDMEMVKWKMGLPNVYTISIDMYIDYIFSSVSNAEYIQIVRYFYEPNNILEISKIFFSEYRKYHNTKILAK